MFYEKKEHPEMDGINPVKMGSRRPTDAGASIFEVHLNLSAAVVFGRTSVRAPVTTQGLFRCAHSRHYCTQFSQHRTPLPRRFVGRVARTGGGLLGDICNELPGY